MKQRELLCRQIYALLSAECAMSALIKFKVSDF